MSINPLNDISKVYLEQVAESAVPGKPAEKLGAVTLIPKAEQEAARKRALAKAKAMREKKGIKEYVDEETIEMIAELTGGKGHPGYKAGSRDLGPMQAGHPADSRKRQVKGGTMSQRHGFHLGDIDDDDDDEDDYESIVKQQSRDKRETVRKPLRNKVKAARKVLSKEEYVDEALDPVSKEDSDVNNDGKKNTNADKYLLKRRKAIGKAISTQEAKEVKRWWDDDGDGKGYEEGEVSGKFKRKRKIKEGFSNWRQDLAEVINDEKSDTKIKEKNVKNVVKTSAQPGGLKIGEAVKELGGTLLEMVEIDEVDYIVESVYDELLDEGYDEDDIEEALEYALTEATVTFGHDTPTGQKKRGNLLKAVGRLARQKLSSKVRGAKTAAKQAVATGARKVAKGALGVARKMEGGDKTPSSAHSKTRTASTYRGAGAGQKERVSSGSYTPPTKKKAEKPADPWKGSSTVPQKPKPKPKVEKPADPWEGSATTPAKPKAKTKKAAAPKAKAPAASPKRKRKSKLDSLLADIRSESVQIDEKTLTKMEMKKREEIVKSMKDKASDFEKRYPGRGKEVMYATATKMAKKVVEQAMELQPKTQPVKQEDPRAKQIQQKDIQTKKRLLQQKMAALQRGATDIDV